MNTKIVLLSILAGMTVLLGISIIALSSILAQRKSHIQQHRKEKMNSDKTKIDVTRSDPQRSVTMFQPERDLQKHSQYAPDPASVTASADSHLFKSMQIFQNTNSYPLGDAGPDLYSIYGMHIPISSSSTVNKNTNDKWQSKFSGFFSILLDILLFRKDPSKHSNQFRNSNETYSSLSMSNSGSMKKHAVAPDEAYKHLEKAAKLGNPDAQHMLANILASFIFVPQNYILSNHKNKNKSNNSSTIPMDFATSDSLSLVLWHYAALSGHFESQLALGYRYTQAYRNIKSLNGLGEGNFGQGNSQGSAQTGKYGIEHATCESAIAYVEAAAHTMMDELERGPWRGKVRPADDTHMLAEIHNLGASGYGASTALLSNNNKPDELDEALQYYRIRATTAPTNPFGSTPQPDVQAPLTLANMHHFGRRGVEQNLSQALAYYEIAAERGSHEAAGIAGKFHLLGIGYDGDEMDGSYNPYDDRITTYQFLGDTEKALKYLKLGAPSPDCIMKDKKDDKNSVCDAEAMNGLGLVYLIGIPNKRKKDVELAKKYFTAAKDKGLADASFHLGLMRLGWRSGAEDDWKSLKENKKNFVTKNKDRETAKGKSKKRQLKHEMEIKKSAPGSQRSVFFQPKEVPVNEDYIEETANLAAVGAGKIDPQLTKELNRMKNVQVAFSEFTNAANKGHMQAIHRLAMIHVRGIHHKTNFKRNMQGRDLVDSHLDERGYDEKYILNPSCDTSLNLYRLLLEGAPTTSRRTRSAYKQYMAGETLQSLKNYMAAAETGSVVGMMNAAWILERHCPFPTDEHWKCKQASLRYWVEAGRMGNTEAILNIGDFYYYNKFEGQTAQAPRYEQTQIISGLQTAINYILFPEFLWKDSKALLIKAARQVMWRQRRKKMKLNKTKPLTCSSEDDTCKSDIFTGDDGSSIQNKNDDVAESNLKKAASYYKRAADDYSSPRANFNLGFMHQWGMGLTQDFPLAKRYYDKAKTINPVVVEIALFGMRWHEKLVRWNLVMEGKRTKIEKGQENLGNIKILLSHFLSWETGLILMMCLILIFLLCRIAKKRARRF